MVSNYLLALSFLAVAACASDDPLICPAGQKASGDKCVCLDGYVKTSGGCEHNPEGLPAIRSNLVDPSGDTGHSIGLTLDGIDVPHLSYYEFNNGDLRYATVIPETGKWKVETVEREADAGINSSIGLVDPLGTPRPVIAYYDASHKSLKGAFRAKSGWVKKFLDPQVSDESFDRGRHTALTVQNAETKHVAHISYIDNISKDLYYIRWDLDKLDDISSPRLVDSGFSTVEGLPYGSGYVDDDTSIALDSQGAPVIAYRDAKTADVKIALYKPDEDVWETSFVDNDPLTQTNLEDLGEHLSLAIDSIDNLHIAYYDRTNYALRYANYDGSDWSIENVDRGNVGTYASLVIRPEDRSPFIAYFDASQGGVKVAHKRKDGTWQVEMAATQGLAGFFVRVAVTRSGWPAIAYRELFSQATYFDYILKPFP